MPLGTKVGLGPGNVVLDGDPAPHGNAQQPPHFSANRSPISATTELVIILAAFKHHIGGIFPYSVDIVVRAKTSYSLLLHYYLF